MRSEIGPPWFARTFSVNGGQCNDLTAACFTVTGSARTTHPRRRYQSPEALASAVDAAPKTWFIPQFYRFVVGSYAGRSIAWDCTSTDWHLHYTSKPELYCYNDFLSVMDALSAAMASGVVVTDPASVGKVWGR